MFRFVLLISMFYLGLAAAQSQAPETPFDEPYQQDVGVEGVIELVGEAQTHVFMVSPKLSQNLGNALYQALRRGVEIYIISAADVPQLVEALRQEGAQVKTLENMNEGLVVTDYKTMAYGGAISGSDAPTTLLDLDLQGHDVMGQLRVLWQEAVPR